MSEISKEEKHEDDIWEEAILKGAKRAVNKYQAKKTQDEVEEEKLLEALDEVENTLPVTEEEVRYLEKLIYDKKQPEKVRERAAKLRYIIRKLNSLIG